MIAAFANAGHAVRGAAASVGSSGGLKVVWQAITTAAKWLGRNALVWLGIDTAATAVKKTAQGVRRAVRGKPDEFAIPVTWETRIKQAPARTARFVGGSLMRFTSTIATIASVPFIATTFLLYAIASAVVGMPTYVVARTVAYPGFGGSERASATYHRSLTPFRWLVKTSVNAFDGSIRLWHRGTDIWHHDYNTDLRRKFVFVPTTTFKVQVPVTPPVPEQTFVYAEPDQATYQMEVPAGAAPAVMEQVFPSIPVNLPTEVTEHGHVATRVVDAEGREHFGISLDLAKIQARPRKFGKQLYLDFMKSNPLAMGVAEKELMLNVRRIAGERLSVLVMLGWEDGKRQWAEQAQNAATAAARAEEEAQKMAHAASAASEAAAAVAGNPDGGTAAPQA